MSPQFNDLLVRLGDDDPHQVDRAFDAILFDREEAVPDLVNAYALAGPEVLREKPTVRFLVVQLLGFTGAVDAIPTVEAALDDPIAYVRAEACRALADLSAATSQAKLQTRLTDSSPEVRLAAAEALEVLRGA